LYISVGVTCEVSVARKGQVTVPFKLRRKFQIDEHSRVQITEANGTIFTKKCFNFYDLAGTGAGEATVEDLKNGAIRDAGRRLRCLKNIMNLDSFSITFT